MYEYKVGDLAEMLTAVLAASRDLGVAEDLGTNKVAQDYCEKLAITLDGLAICCTNCDVDSSLLKQMRTLEHQLKAGQADTRCSILHARLATLLEGVQDNLEKRKFMFIPADQAWYWDNPNLFGPEFLASFPQSAWMEMNQVGRCYAASLGTACVFHCMRVAEYGVRRLARRVGATITHKGQRVPLQYGDWDTVITAIKNKINEARQKPRGPGRERLLQYYSNVLTTANT